MYPYTECIPRFGDDNNAALAAYAGEAKQEMFKSSHDELVLEDTTKCEDIEKKSLSLSDDIDLINYTVTDDFSELSQCTTIWADILTNSNPNGTEQYY